MCWTSSSDSGVGCWPGADESGDARRGLHHVPDVIVHVHFNQHVAGIEHALGGVLLAAAHFGDGFGGDQHFADLLLQPESRDPRLQRLLHLALKPRVGVDDVPLHVRILGRFGGSGSTFRADRGRFACSSWCGFVFFFFQHHGASSWPAVSFADQLSSCEIWCEISFVTLSRVNL